MKYLVLILFLTIFKTSTSQVATVQDKDGFSNVRIGRSSKSRIIYKLKTTIAFFFETEEFYDDKEEWIKVYIAKNSFSLDSPLKYLEGFVHRSRIKPLEERQDYNGDNFSFKLESKPFSKDGKIIDYIDEKYIFNINGLPPIGIDGNVPKSEVEQIKIQFNGKTMIVSQALTMDLFECKNDAVIYKVDDTFFVYQNCSDGAGYYQLVWSINTKGVQQRLIGSFY